MEILGATEEPKSATQLSEALDIPIATCYRRVGELVSVGLLDEHAADEDDTAGAAHYRRTTDAVGIQFAPTPSVFAWAYVRHAVGADASTLSVPRASGTPGQADFAPMGGHSTDLSGTSERQVSVEKDV